MDSQYQLLIVSVVLSFTATFVSRSGTKIIENWYRTQLNVARMHFRNSYVGNSTQSLLPDRFAKIDL